MYKMRVVERVTLAALGLTTLSGFAILMWRDTALVVPPVPSASVRWAAQLEIARRLDLNTASAAEVQRLPGIGPVLAGRILAFRVQRGRLQDVQELRQVRGIGPQRLEQITPYLMVR